MSKSKYFEIESRGRKFVVFNLVTGLPIFQSQDEDEIEREPKEFTTFESALTCGRDIAQKYYNIYNNKYSR
jgi:hypothetical protein